MIHDYIFGLIKGQAANTGIPRLVTFDLTFSKPDGTSILLPKVSINRRHFCFLWGERSNIYLLCSKRFTIYFLHFVLFAWFQRDIFSFFSFFCLNYYILVEFEFVELFWILLFFFYLFHKLYVHESLKAS